MVRHLLRPVLALAALGFMVGVAAACPLCDSETGEQVRAGIFNADFGATLLLTLLPFPVLLVIVAAVHFGLPWIVNAAPPAAVTEGDATTAAPGEEISR